MRDRLSSIDYNELDSKISNIENLENLQKKIILSNDSAAAYFFAIEYGYKPYLMQKLILNNKDVKYSFLFAQNIKNSDIKAFQKIIIDSGNIKYISKFADLNGADFKLLESIILKSKMPQYICKLLKHKAANLNKIKKIILASKNAKALFELSKYTNNLKELSIIEDLLVESKSFTYLRLFAEKIKTSNIERIEQVILDSDNVEEIKKFAKYVKRSKMKRFFLIL